MLFLVVPVDPTGCEHKTVVPEVHDVVEQDTAWS
jgi:hypothetical protein